MAVRAEQNALACLGTTSSEGSRVAVLSYLKLLEPGIQMMKLERAQPTSITAQRTSAASFLYELSLDSAPAL